MKRILKSNIFVNHHSFTVQRILQATQLRTTPATNSVTTLSTAPPLALPHSKPSTFLFPRPRSVPFLSKTNERTHVSRVHRLLPPPRLSPLRRNYTLVRSKRFIATGVSCVAIVSRRSTGSGRDVDTRGCDWRAGDSIRFRVQQIGLSGELLFITSGAQPAVTHERPDFYCGPANYARINEPWTIDCATRRRRRRTPGSFDLCLWRQGALGPVNAFPVEAGHTIFLINPSPAAIPNGHRRGQ